VAEASWPNWTQFAVGDSVEVRVDDVWRAAEIEELQKLESTYSYCVWLVGSKDWLDLETSAPDDFDGALRRRFTK
jgi:hypothetical protein